MSIRDVQEFHRKFGFPDGSEDVISKDASMQEFRVDFLQEELHELECALREGNRTKAFDALLDLVYVAHGTALGLGITPFKWHCGEAAVHKANMSKVAVARVEESKRGHIMDVVKPEGWAGPEELLKRILELEDLPSL